MSTHPNFILKNLSASDLKLFEGALTAVSFTHGELVGEAGTPIESVYFLNSGLISIVVPLANGEAIEAGVIGRHDVYGASVAFGAKFHMNRAMIQMPGSASVIKSADLIVAANASPTLRHELFLQDQFMLAQSQQSAACNAKHNIPQRLASWLLRVSDRSQQDELPLTQEFLSQMLGVQRASVSIAAGEMQDAGIIRYQRGNVRIIDRAKLEHIACECYAALRIQRQRMLKQAGAPEPGTIRVAERAFSPIKV